MKAHKSETLTQNREAPLKGPQYEIQNQFVIQELSGERPPTLEGLNPTNLKKHYYDQAIVRNLGILSEKEQQKLKKTRVAIAGMGGMGGVDFLTLVRMGIGHFNIADYDTFSIVNSNRQVGANQSTVGFSKIDVMKKMALDIAPDLQINTFPEGFNAENAETFLRDVDIVIDAIDFFCLSAREKLYEKAREYKKTVLISAPLGFSSTFHIFTPDGMSFHDYFDIRPDMDGFDKFIAFAIGLAPAALHSQYMVFSPEKIAQGIGSSIGSACNLGSAFVATALVSTVLQRQKPMAAPHYLQIDPYLMRMKKGRLVLGNKGPIQRLKRFLFKQIYKKYRTEINKIVK